MNYNEVKQFFKKCTQFSKGFNKFFLEIEPYLNEIDKQGFENKFKIEINNYIYFFDIWSCLKEKELKNQKQPLFLISKYSKDRSVLYNSFKFEVEFENSVVLSITNWQKLENDYRTETKQIVLNKQELII